MMVRKVRFGARMKLVVIELVVVTIFGWLMVEVRL